MKRAPTCRATAIDMRPIGPQPVTSTSSPTTENVSAVCTALPNGSKIAPTFGSMGDVCTHTLAPGITTNSANAPSRCRPTPCVRMHICRRPARQLRHMPHTMWPSPDTRSPTMTSCTSSPTSTTSP
jgi:hypothetical protein